jgi:hypothetical protein
MTCPSGLLPTVSLAREAASTSNGAPVVTTGRLPLARPSQERQVMSALTRPPKRTPPCRGPATKLFTPGCPRSARPTSPHAAGHPPRREHLRLSP